MTRSNRENLTNPLILNEQIPIEILEGGHPDRPAPEHHPLIRAIRIAHALMCPGGQITWESLDQAIRVAEARGVQYKTAEGLRSGRMATAIGWQLIHDRALELAAHYAGVPTNARTYANIAAKAHERLLRAESAIPAPAAAPAAAVPYERSEAERIANAHAWMAKFK